MFCATLPSPSRLPPGDNQCLLSRCLKVVEVIYFSLRHSRWPWTFSASPNGTAHLWGKLKTEAPFPNIEVVLERRPSKSTEHFSAQHVPVLRYKRKILTLSSDPLPLFRSNRLLQRRRRRPFFHESVATVTAVTIRVNLFQIYYRHDRRVCANSIRYAPDGRVEGYVRGLSQSMRIPFFLS